MSTFGIILGIFICLLVIYLIHIYRGYSFFEQFHITGPKPTFLLGNVGDFIRTKRISTSIQNWSAQFGRVYGYFEGHTPIFVISDPDILHEIFIKQFSKFHSRRQFPLEDRSTTKGVHLFSATGDEWRRQRGIVNPTFSAPKMKQMMSTIDECITTLRSRLEDSIEKSIDGFDIYKLYQRFTMDVIWRCFFNFQTDMQNDPNNPYLKRSQDVFAREKSTYLATLLSIFIPELQSLWLTMHHCLNDFKAKLRKILPVAEKFIGDDPNEWLKNNVDGLIKSAAIYQENVNDYNENIIKPIDLIHILLGATEKNPDDLNPNNNTVRKLSLDEVKQNIYLFMVAGYETTSTALAYITYVLATHPDEQRKLRDHINSHLPDTTTIDYEKINKMDYLEWFIRETLRMYPISPIIVNRECAESIDLPNLGRVSPGTKFTLDMYSVHYDNDLWGPVDTKIFYPERFSIKRHPAAWLAFGLGPRSCIGMRFALIEMKMILIRLLQNYTVLPGLTNDNNLEYVELVTIVPKQVCVRLQHRLRI